jgi:aspartate/glutamate racemase
MHHDSHIEGVILGGTELPLLLRETSGRDIRLLDTGRIHMESAVEHMLA